MAAAVWTSHEGASAPRAGVGLGHSNESCSRPSYSNGTLSNTTVSSGDCKAAFALYNSDNTTKGGAGPFANCTASGTSASAPCPLALPMPGVSTASTAGARGGEGTAHHIDATGNIHIRARFAAKRDAKVPCIGVGVGVGVKEHLNHVARGPQHQYRTYYTREPHREALALPSLHRLADPTPAYMICLDHHPALPCTAAAGDKINVRVNQTVLRDAANASAVPAALAVTVQPLLTSATLTAPGVISVKLPFALAGGLTMNASVCAATFELRAAGAAAAKPAPFAACSFSTDTARLTLTSPSLLASGDTVNVVDGQTSLLYGTAPYARSDSGLAIAPTITSVSLTSATTVTIGTAAPVAPLADTSAAACNAIFDVRLANTTTLAAPFGSCSVAADSLSVVATFATNVSFAGGARAVWRHGAKEALLA